jgi:hypothetical protein
MSGIILLRPPRQRIQCISRDAKKTVIRNLHVGVLLECQVVGSTSAPTEVGMYVSNQNGFSCWFDADVIARPRISQREGTATLKAGTSILLCPLSGVREGFSCNKGYLSLRYARLLDRTSDVDVDGYRHGNSMRRGCEMGRFAAA